MGQIGQPASQASWLICDPFIKVVKQVNPFMLNTNHLMLYRVCESYQKLTVLIGGVLKY
jgi:uncharacterized protein YprB with RNaseH-like and TPR domain